LRASSKLRQHGCLAQFTSRIRLMHPNQVAIDKAYRERQREAGVVPVRVMCPADRVEELKAMVRQWRVK
jgi:hypothetical protein